LRLAAAAVATLLLQQLLVSAASCVSTKGPLKKARILGAAAWLVASIPAMQLPFPDHELLDWQSKVLLLLLLLLLLSSSCFRRQDELWKKPILSSRQLLNA
jgi:uncharacterized membrane protein YfcA